MSGGRPPTLGQTARVADDGRKVSVAEVIVDEIRCGEYVETAAAVAGVSKDTVYAWLKRGARARRRAIRADAPVEKAERRYVAFSDAVARATAESEARDVKLLAQLGAGGIEMRHTTEKYVVEAQVEDPDGQHEPVLVEKLVERTTKVETTLPDARVLMWRLERRYTKRWGRQGSLEITGPDGEPLLAREDQARELSAALRDFQAGAEAERARQAEAQQ